MSEQTYLETQLERISIDKFSISHQNVFKSNDNKDVQIKNWLIEKIKGFDIINDNKFYLLPSKAEFAYRLNVSIGTVQSAIRLLEDEGYVVSKQRVGTMINNHSTTTSSIKKSFSKKDKAYTVISEFLQTQHVNYILPSTRLLAAQFGFSQNTIRLALDTLVQEGYIQIKKNSNSNFAWILKKIPVNKKATFENLSLIEKISNDLINFMAKNSKIGDKLPSHNVLSQKFSVSIKTINDVIKKLSDKGFLETRRGRYGTIVIKNSNNYQPNTSKPETSIFAHASVAFEYNYQKVKKSIVDYIIDNYEVGTKLPTLQEFSEIFDVSTNTIRKALTELSKDGYISFQRGRFGGTFLIAMPKTDNKTTFKWLAVSPAYQEVYNN